jgi:hypothetical protein
MSIIEIGYSFRRHGHEYEVVGFRPHVTRFGHEVELVQVVAECTVCGERYGATITRSVARGSHRNSHISRTCPEHRGLGPRWRKPPMLIDAAVTALAERPATFLTARQLAEATGRSASGMGGALIKAFRGQPGNVLKTERGRVLRLQRRGRPTLYLLDTGRRHLARVKREALAAWLTAHAPQTASKPAKRIATWRDAYLALGL